jgi:hypothetical protein
LACGLSCQWLKTLYMSKTKNKDQTLYEQACRVIDKKHSRYYQVALHKGRQDGIKNMPPLHGAFLLPYVNPVVKNYKTLLAWCNAKLQPELQIELSEARRMHVENENVTKQNEIADLEGKKAIAESEVEDTFPLWEFLSFFAGCAISAGIIGAEWVNMSRSLQVLGGSKYNSQLLGLGLALSMALVADLSQVWIDTIESKLGKQIASAAVITGMAATFYGLAMLREETMQKLYGTEGHMMYFVLINMVLFLGLFLIFKYLIKPKISAVRDASIDLYAKWKISRLKAGITKRVNAIAANLRHLQKYLEDRLIAHRNAKNANTKIACNLDQSISAYMEGNLQTRTDGGVPDCFTGSHPTLDSFNNPTA